MARRRRESGIGLLAPNLDHGLAIPPPHGTLHVTFAALRKGETLHRVHHCRYKSDQFNPSIRGNARFSPIQDRQGKPIPTLYAGTTSACALMETVFHDVPHTPGFKAYDKNKLLGQVHSTVQVKRDLQVVDLASVPLRKLGVTRRQLIDTEKDQYPITRKWAEAIHHQWPQTQGLSWISRQDDSARAYVLFGDRIPVDALGRKGESRSLLDDSKTYDEVLNLAERMGVNIVGSSLSS